MVKLDSKVTCPFCGHAWTATMPSDSCQHLIKCPGCGEVLTPLERDCCVFCSFGDTPCPPLQGEDAHS